MGEKNDVKDEQGFVTISEARKSTPNAHIGYGTLPEETNFTEEIKFRERQQLLEFLDRLISLGDKNTFVAKETNAIINRLMSLFNFEVEKKEGKVSYTQINGGHLVAGGCCKEDKGSMTVLDNNGDAIAKLDQNAKGVATISTEALSKTSSDQFWGAYAQFEQYTALKPRKAKVSPKTWDAIVTGFMILDASDTDKVKIGDVDVYKTEGVEDDVIFMECANIRFPFPFEHKE